MMTPALKGARRSSAPKQSAPNVRCIGKMVADDSQCGGDGGARHNGKERNGKDRRGELSSIVSCVHKCGVQALPSVLKNARKGTKILEYPHARQGGISVRCKPGHCATLADSRAAWQDQCAARRSGISARRSNCLARKAGPGFDSAAPYRASCCGHALVYITASCPLIVYFDFA